MTLIVGRTETHHQLALFSDREATTKDIYLVGLEGCRTCTTLISLNIYRAFQIGRETVKQLCLKSVPLIAD